MILKKIKLYWRRRRVRQVEKLLRKVAQAGTQVTSTNVLHTLLPAWEELISRQAPPRDGRLSEHARRTLVDYGPEALRAFIPSLEKRPAPVMNTWVYQNEVMQWDISSDELVLDVGSGGWPFKRANHLADKYPDETTHRVEEMVRDGRPFFNADLQQLPFEDRQYDFVFCSHVLEHLDNPGAAIRELQRVGRRGYIEVPTRLSDVMFNFTRIPDHHRWHGFVQGNTLILAEWNAWERRDLGNHFFEALQSDYFNEFQVFFERNRDLFFASYHWSERIDFLVIDKHGKVIDSSQNDS